MKTATVQYEALAYRVTYGRPDEPITIDRVQGGAVIRPELIHTHQAADLIAAVLRQEGGKDAGG